MGILNLVDNKGMVKGDLDKWEEIRQSIMIIADGN